MWPEHPGLPGSSSAGRLGDPRSLEPLGTSSVYRRSRATCAPTVYEVAAKRTGGLPPPRRRAHAVVSSPLSPDIWSRGSVCCALRAHAAYELPRTSHSVSHFAFAFLAGAPARPTMLAARKAPGLTGVEGSLSPLCVHRPPSSGQPHTPAWSCPDPAVLPLLPHNVKCTGTGSRQVWL